jgi:hypothetical protein
MSSAHDRASERRFPASATASPGEGKFQMPKLNAQAALDLNSVFMFDLNSGF